MGLQPINQIPCVCHDLADASAFPLPNRTPRGACLFPNEQAEDQDWSGDAEDEKDDQEDDCPGPPQIEGPPHTAPQWDEHGGILSIEVDPCIRQCSSLVGRISGFG